LHPWRERANELLPLIATIGVSITLQNVMLVLLGPIPYAFDTPYSNNVIRFGGIFLTVQSVLIIMMSTIAIGLLYAFMKFYHSRQSTARGLAGPRNRGADGHQSNQLIMLTFVIASALAGMSGAMLGPVLVLTPFAGTTVIVKAFAIVIIGGFGNVEGTIIAG